MIETVAAQESLAQDEEKHMPVKRMERTKDKVARAYWLQAYFENGQILIPDKSIARNYNTWQALLDELLLFPQSEHDDLFDGLQTMMEGAMSVRSYPSGYPRAVFGGSMRDDLWDDMDWHTRRGPWNR
jgi:predicted phage terminase large subunit-like protein